MGHIINPVTTRLGLNTFWNSRWTLNNNYNYSRLFKKNLFFFNFLNWFFQKKVFSDRNIILSHYQILLNSKNELYINLYHFLEFFSKNRSRSYFPSLFKFVRRRYRYRLPYKLILRKYSYFSQNKMIMLYWHLCQNNIAQMLSSTNNNRINKVRINFINLTFRNVNANIILKYIRLRLISKYSLNYILKPILRDLHLRMRRKKILGYKILCAGRFTRKQIAAKMWFKQGPVSVNNFENLIKYNQIKVRLKYGVCGIKMWINYGGPTTGRCVQNLTLGYPLVKSLQFKLLFSLKYEYNFLLNSASFYLFQLFNFKNKNKKSYVYYINNIFFIRLYGYFSKFLKKEMRLFLKKKQTKSLSYLPFITLHKNDSRNVRVKFNPNSFFNLSKKKYFVYK